MRPSIAAVRKRRIGLVNNALVGVGLDTCTHLNGWSVRSFGNGEYADPAPPIKANQTPLTLGMVRPAVGIVGHSSKFLSR